MKEKIAAAVVTFNRLKLLKKVINGLRNQIEKPDIIIVINNNSNDGTSDWLNHQKDIKVINQKNTGSSGGQFTSIKTAYDLGYDWIWIMDDDVVPNEKCLLNLKKHLDKKIIIAPLRRNLENEIYYNDTISFNLSNPFKSIWIRILDDSFNFKRNIYAEGITFEGPLFHRSLVDKIGLPEKKFFIYGDDTEYFIRAKKAGFKSYLVPEAKLIRQLPPPENDKKYNWKTYYELRNIIAIDVLHGNFPVRYLRPFAYFFDRLIRVKNIKQLRVILSAFLDGYFYKSVN